MRRVALFLPLVAAAGLACATYNRGSFAAASATPVPVPMTTVREDAQGSACGQGFPQRLENAVEDALRRAPGANALVDVSFYFERFCIVVRGRAVHIAAERVEER